MTEAPADSEPSYFGFVITVREDAGFTRNELTAFLEKNKIETRNLFCGNNTVFSQKLIRIILYTLLIFTPLARASVQGWLCVLFI
ncbi:Pyridoxal phosphate-dependent transferase domain-containing protein [Desulfonema limicola]|uniref:Pyridoxal phosphate-dependent transferase domain-containing protein n=1 Tax=Desulfonema limicola TaxID=45656 RepID=A0A975GFH7_9BACT|nr:hypothetical protein [Desulfonema limicola]QTA79184.1 Pyridoxal phosphate-dependent transferase domain-containing protein [Desulfonema limicola]